jgi:DNA-directed RNA polymerase subunit RPC12/RpoP
LARGVLAMGQTKEEAEQQVRAGAPQMRILRSRPISLAGLPPLRTSGPLDDPWVVVVEHQDPAEEAKLLQHEDPEAEVERSCRELYLNLATDPDALVTSVYEAFDCPACSTRIEVKLRPPRDVRFETTRPVPRAGSSWSARRASWRGEPLGKGRVPRRCAPSATTRATAAST